jgi:group I intron endonuclease
MAYIYKITNKLNYHSYIGKTTLSIKERWREHIRESKREKNKNRPLYNAINKYGIENFIIEPIEEISSEVASLREQYWIGYYNTFENGYNATIGGDGTIYRFTKQEEIDFIVSEYKSGKICKVIAKELDCDPQTILRVLKDNNTLTGLEKQKYQYLQSFGIIMINGNEELEFNTKEECINYIVNLNPNVQHRSISSSINRALAGKRKTYLGYRFIRVDKD